MYERSLRWYNFPYNLIYRAEGKENFIFFAKLRLLLGIVVFTIIEIISFHLLITSL